MSAESEAASEAAVQLGVKIAEKAAGDGMYMAFWSALASAFWGTNLPVNDPERFVEDMDKIARNFAYGETSS